MKGRKVVEMTDCLIFFFFLCVLLISSVAWHAVFISWAHADIYSTIHTVQTHIYYYRGPFSDHFQFYTALPKSFPLNALT